MSRPRRATPGGGRGARGSEAWPEGGGPAVAAARGLAGGGAAGGSEGAVGRGAFLGRWRRRPPPPLCLLPERERRVLRARWCRQELRRHRKAPGAPVPRMGVGVVR